MAKLVLPPDAGTGYRKRVRRWAHLYDREGVETSSPNYAAWVADIVTGLYQAEPPSITLDGDPLDQAADDAGDDVGDADRDQVDEDWATELTHHTIDLLEEAGERQAGMGLAVLRPVYDGERWTHQVLDPTHFAPYWNHRRLEAAVVWTFLRMPDSDNGEDDFRRIAIVEYWGMSRPTPGNPPAPITAPETVIAVGELDMTGMTFTASEVYDSLDAVPEQYGSIPAVADAFTDEAGEDDRELIPVPWRWSSGDPVPIYFRNEGVITGTEKLHNVEQEDAVMVRKRVAMSKDLLGRSDVTYNNAPGGRTLARAGWQMESNLLLLEKPTGSWSEDGGNAPFEVIEFDDDLTQADRIDRHREWILTHCGINPQSVGMSVSGRSDSAAAKRADQQQTMNTVSGPARKLSAALSLALTQEERLNGGTSQMTVTVHEGLKPVQSESVDTAAKMDAADLADNRTIVEKANPGRSDAEITTMLTNMEAEGRIVAADE